MINLFNINNYVVDTASFSNHLHDKIVTEFENSFAQYVGAKYACSINSATNAIFLLFLNKNIEVSVPSLIPPVVLNALVTSRNRIKFTDDTNWVGGPYVLHDFGDYKVIDSAQAVIKDQFKLQAQNNDVMFFSFYPTKPVGGIDGGMIVSNDFDKIQWLKEAVMNGMSFAENNWDRKIKFAGYKMYLNSIQAKIASNNFSKLESKKERLFEIRNVYNKTFGTKNTSDHLFRINVDNNKKFIEYAKNKGFICGIHYESQHKNPIYSNCESDCPKSETESRQTVSIPFHENLDSGNLNLIINAVKDYSGTHVV